MAPRLLGFSGSARKASLNTRLLALALSGAAAAGADVASVSLADFEMPLYDGDWEAEHGLPDSVRALARIVAAHDGLLIATPEHNGGYTALLKNALDWLSRPDPADSAWRSPLAGKSAAVISASPGLLGGMRSQIGLQIVLTKLGMTMIPDSFALGSAHVAFDDAGGLKDPGAETGVRAVGAALARQIATRS